MAQITQDSPNKKQPPRSSSFSSSWFLGCFCFPKSTQQKVKEKNKTTRYSSWFSRSRKSLKKSVPVGDDASSEKLHQKRNESFRMPKFSKKFSANKLPAAGKTQALQVEGGKVEENQIPAAATGGGGGDEAGLGGADNKEGDEDNQTQINLQNGKSIAKEPATYKKGVVFSRRNSWSQPSTSSSSEQKMEISQQAPVLLHSASMTAGRVYPVQANGGDSGGDGGESCERKAGKSEELVGMSIIVVTLIIMIIWGKLCAILCTSAWLYFYQSLRSTKNHHHHQQPNKHNNNNMMMMRNGSKSLDGLDNHIESKKSKKKVVFEGFLERNHRANGG